jgi:hypothetical protein
MIKKLSLIAVYIIISKKIFAQTANIENTQNLQLIILLILLVAVAALVMSIINYFRILHNQKVTRAYLSNLSDDVATTISKYNSTFEKEIKSLKREKNKKPQKNKSEIKNKPLLKNTGELTDNVYKEETVENKQTKRRPYRRRPVKSKQQSEIHNQNKENKTK